MAWICHKHNKSNVDGFDCPRCLTEDGSRVPQPTNIEDGLKYDDGKQLDHLSPPFVKSMMVNALKYGTIKYFKDSWRAGFKLSRMYDATNHHIDAFFHQREDIDPESGVHHLDCALFSVAMMRYSTDLEGKDDRPPVTPEQIAEVIRLGMIEVQKRKGE